MTLYFGLQTRFWHARLFITIVELSDARLKPGGWLAFSVELCGGEHYTADPTTGRYLHSKAYLNKILAEAFTRVTFQPWVIRYNGGQALEGYLVFAQTLPHHTG